MTDKLSDLTIRRAIPDDLDCLVDFNAALALETEDKCLDRNLLSRGTQAVLADPSHGFYLVAGESCSGRVIGQVMVTYEWSDWRNATFWWLQSVYVSQDWRGKGVFGNLYRFLMTAAEQNQNVAGIRLYVEKTNSLAQEVYENLGLAATSYLVYETDFVLGKRDESPETS